MKLRVTLVVLAVIATSIRGQGLSGLTKTPITGGPQFPNSMVAGPDGNTWFTDFKGNTVGRLTPGGAVTVFPLPSPNSVVDTITSGMDGNLWFTEDAGRIGRITPLGAITEFPVGNAMNPTSLITSGADGALWFLDQPASNPPGPPVNVKLGRITTDGTLTTYDLGSKDIIVVLLTGPNGDIWFYDITKNAMVDFDIGKNVVAASHPVPQPAGGFLNHAVIGPDGNLWFTHANNVARMKVDGTVTEYPVPTANAQPSAISLGGDGNIWFTEYQANKLGQLIVSTATDSGQATINESGAILDAGAIEMVLSGGHSTAGKTAMTPEDALPCGAQTFVMRFTVSGIWYSISWAVLQTQCADIRTYVLFEGQQRGQAVLFGAGQLASVTCSVTNLGPSIATNVVVNCDSSSGDIGLRGATLSCIKNGGAFTGAGSGVRITVPSLSVGNTCVFNGPFFENSGVIESTGLISVTEFGYADQFDPHMGNNLAQQAFDPQHPGAKITPPIPVIGPIERGPNH